ncbi:biotin--[acetyl-CoA-carboxylase] ligase [Microbacterium sediminicola]|uniref:biotin--[biotin carboxyl-carrier protein] ligase n=2 Tax=Microbacterium sediminicola TaxID=415210 RepID=A0ABN2HJY8_9MICO
MDVVDSTGSTNADLVAAATAQPDAYPHLSVLMTDDQRAGRGRLDRVWEAPPGASLAVSVLVDVAGVPIAARGWIPLIAGAAMTLAVRAGAGARAEAVDVALKWPNDVLIDGYKVCGILAEVVTARPGVIVIGAGVNTRMTRAQLPVPTATSLAIAGWGIDEDALVAAYLENLDRMLRRLTASSGDAEHAGIRAEIARMCATIGRQVTVSLPGGDDLRGTARDLDDDGLLLVDTADGQTTAVAAGDVIHLR